MLIGFDIDRPVSRRSGPFSSTVNVACYMGCHIDSEAKAASNSRPDHHLQRNRIFPTRPRTCARATFATFSLLSRPGLSSIVNEPRASCSVGNAHDSNVDRRSSWASPTLQRHVSDPQFLPPPTAKVGGKIMKNRHSPVSRDAKRSASDAAERSASRLTCGEPRR